MQEEVVLMTFPSYEETIDSLHLRLLQKIAATLLKMVMALCCNFRQICRYLEGFTELLFREVDVTEFFKFLLGSSRPDTQKSEDASIPRITRYQHDPC